MRRSSSALSGQKRASNPWFQPSTSAELCEALKACLVLAASQNEAMTGTAAESAAAAAVPRERPAAECCNIATRRRRQAALYCEVDALRSAERDGSDEGSDGSAFAFCAQWAVAESDHDSSGKACLRAATPSEQWPFVASKVPRAYTGGLEWPEECNSPPGAPAVAAGEDAGGADWVHTSCTGLLVGVGGRPLRRSNRGSCSSSGGLDVMERIPERWSTLV